MATKLLPLFLLFFLCSALCAQPGTLDSSFATNGVIVFNVPGQDVAHSQGIIQQPDGKYVCGGRANTPDDAHMLALRLKNNGAIDSTFGTFGYVYQNVYHRTFSHTVNIQADGKILLLGQDYQPIGNLEDFGMLRLNPNGSLDSTFGDGGKLALDYGLGEEGYKVFERPNHELMVMGFSTWDMNSSQSEILKNNFCVGKLHADGSRDSTFGMHGVFTWDMSNTNDFGTDMVVLPDGKLVVNGLTNLNSIDRGVALKLDSTGVLDPSFGTGGIISSLTGHESNWHAIDLQADGKLVMSGQTYDNLGNSDILAERFNTDGSVDNTFGINGRAIFDLGQPVEKAEDVKVQADGKIILSGYSGIETSAAGIVMRLNADGTRDTTFGVNGVFTLDDYPAYFFKLKESIIDQDGKIVSSGYLQSIPQGPDHLIVFRLKGGDGTGGCALPSAAGIITQSGGSAKVCPGTTRTYSVSADAAITFNWSVPPGALINSGQGTNSISVTFNNNLNAIDSIRVVKVNTCGSGPQSKLAIKRNNPAKPSPITGDAFGLCENTSAPFSVNNVAGITYNWISPVGASVASGQGTNAVTINFAGSQNSGTVSVTANNTCGTSTARTKAVKTIPATPPSVIGATSVCANQAGVPYSIAPVAGATLYKWTGPSGSHISDGTTTSLGSFLNTTATSITVTYGSTAGKLKVQAKNNCGQGTTKTVSISIVCKQDEATISYDAGNFVVSPNPSSGTFNIHFGNRVAIGSITVINVLGEKVYEETISGQTQMEIDLGRFGSGVYFLSAVTDGMLHTQKLIVE